MRILTFDGCPSAARGGQELSLFEESVGLLERGHALALGYVDGGDLLGRYAAAGARLVRLPALGVRRRAGMTPLAEFAAAAVRAALERADVVLVNQYHDALLGAVVAAVRRVPLVCHLRLNPPEVFSRQWRAGLRRVTRFIAVSEYTRNAWAAAGVEREKIALVHDGVDMERFRPCAREREAMRAALAIPTNAFVALYAGRIDRWKNLEAMIDAFAALASSVPSARLVVAGAPVDHASAVEGQTYVAELKARATRLRVADRVHWLGPRQDVPALLNAADAGLLFSHGESFGRATVEALATGIPMVATRQGGGGEILSGEFARLTFDARRPEDAVAILISLVEWRRQDPNFAHRARQHVVQCYGKAAMVEGIETVLSAVSSRRGRAGAGPVLDVVEEGGSKP